MCLRHTHMYIYIYIHTLFSPCIQDMESLGYLFNINHPFKTWRLPKMGSKWWFQHVSTSIIHVFTRIFHYKLNEPAIGDPPWLWKSHEIWVSLRAPRWAPRTWLGQVCLAVWTPGKTFLPKTWEMKEHGKAWSHLQAWSKQHGRTCRNLMYETQGTWSISMFLASSGTCPSWFVDPLLTVYLF